VKSPFITNQTSNTLQSMSALGGKRREVTPQWSHIGIRQHLTLAVFSLFQALV